MCLHGIKQWCCWNEAGAACAVTVGGAAAGVLGLLVLLGLPGADGVLAGAGGEL